jgi:hypothetical protein
MMMSSGQLASRHLETSCNPTGMGWYSYQTFNGANGTKLMFITAYRVCFQSIKTAGDTTFFFHQWHSLLQDGHKTPNPRKQVLLNLKELILGKIGQGYNVCIVCISMDANEELDSRNNQLLDWIEQCGLVSAHEHFYDAEYYDRHPVPSTYDRGPNKIDFVLCTPRLFTCIESVSIEAMNEGTASDHLGLIVDLNTEKLLGVTANISKNKSRILKSTTRKASGQFRSKLYNMLSRQNVFDCADSVINIYEKHGVISKRGHIIADQLNQYITSCMIKSENTIKVYSTEDFSPEKVKRADLERFWKLAEQAVRKDEQLPTPPMATIMAKYPEENYESMDDIHHIIEQLKECREDHKRAIKNSKEIQTGISRQNQQLFNSTTLKRRSWYTRQSAV